MAKIQSRRCVSLNRSVYEDLKRYSKSSGVPMSAFIEDLIRAAMARSGETSPAKVLQFAPRAAGRGTPVQSSSSTSAGRSNATSGPVKYAGGVHQF